MTAGEEQPISAFRRIREFFRSETARGNLTLLLAVIAIVVSAISTIFAGKANTRSEQQQRADRLASAATLLSSEAAGARVAGVRAMAALAGDFPAEGPTVLDLLSAHISGQAAQRVDPLTGVLGCSPLGRDVREALRAVTDLYTAQRVKDIEAGHRPYELDLSGACLDFTGTNLNCANLTGAHPQDTEFHRTQLAGANLSYSTFKKTKVEYTGLREADLRNANLNMARFINLTAERFAVNADHRGATWDGATIDSPATAGTVLPAGFDA